MYVGYQLHFVHFNIFCFPIFIQPTQVVLSVGYFLSCISPNVDVALAIAPVVIIPFMLFGGFFLNSGSVPVRSISFISELYILNVNA